MHTYIHAYTHVHIQAGEDEDSMDDEELWRCQLTYIHTCMHTYIHAYTHVHIQVGEDEDSMDDEEFRSVCRQLNAVFSSSGKIELLRQATSVFPVDGAQVMLIYRLCMYLFVCMYVCVCV
jgi:hypothetical protein